MQTKQIQIYKDYLNMLFEGHIHSVLCHSKAGYGKTYTTIKTLKELGKDYIYNSGVTTAVALYKMFYDNNDKVIVLDDIETIFKDDRIINLLKAALWDVDGKRRISYKSTSKTLEDYPDSFEFTGKLIILANEIQGRNDESYKALMSRCLKYELTYNLQEILDISKNIIHEDDSLTQEQKDRIIQIIDTYIRPEHCFNFRLLERLKSFVKYDIEKSEQLFLASIDIDEDVAILVDIIKENEVVKDQIEKYRQVTGKSRMTFFRKKKQLKDEGMI